MAESGAYLEQQQPSRLGRNSRFVSILREWRNYAKAEYGMRRPQDLKVAYLCGPSPSNDLRAMVDLGVAIHNVWAIESERDAREKALNEARESFPELKVVPFRANRLFESRPTTFDIVYLDFTAPLFSFDKKPYDALHALFDHQVLADLSIVIVNSAFPDDTPENRAFLASFPAAMPWVPAKLTHDMVDPDPAFDRRFERYTDGAGPRGETPFDFASILEKADLNDLYSLFATGYPIAYGSAIQPYLSTASATGIARARFRDE